MKAVVEKKELKVTIEVNESELTLLHALIGLTKTLGVNRIFSALGMTAPEPYRMFMALDAIMKENKLQTVAHSGLDIEELVK